MRLRKLLWRLCDEQTQGGGSNSAAVDKREKSAEETLNAIHTLYNIIQVREAAVQKSVSGSGSSSSSTTPAAVIVMLDELIDRYHTLTAESSTTTGSSNSSAVLNHQTTIQFIQALTVAYSECGERDKAKRIVRSTLLCDEKEHVDRHGGEGLVELENGTRYRHAIAHYFLGIAAYKPHPPEHGQYEWSESHLAWKQALACLNPFIARLSSTHNVASLAATLESRDSLTLLMLRLWVATADNLSEAQWTSGKKETAMATLRHSIDIVSGLLPSHNSDLLRSRHRLITRLLSTADSVAEALKECAYILSLEPRLLSTDSASSLDELAQSLFRLRHFQYAAHFFQHSIAVREEAASAATPLNDDTAENVTLASALTTAARYNDLGWCEIQLDQYKSAEEHFRRSIELTEATMGKSHPECAVSVHNLSFALMRQQRFEEAEIELQRARKLYESKFEIEQPTPSSSLVDRDAVRGKLASLLGQCYAKMKRWTDSVAEYERAVACTQRAMGDHPSVAASLFDLGHTLLQSGAHTEAVSTFQRMKETAERLYGAEHSMSTKALHWLAVAESAAGRLVDAVSHSRLAVARGERLHAVGKMQLDTLDNMKAMLTAILRAQDDGRVSGAKRV